MAYSEYGNGGEGGSANPGTYIAEQVFDLERGYAKGPERALLAALLFDGVQAYMNYACASTEGTRDRYKEAFSWVNRSGEDYVFAFENVCEALGIDAQFLRLGLLNASNSVNFDRKKNRRSF